MQTSRSVISLSCLLVCVLAWPAAGLTPKPLENAYWRLEEGTAGQPVAATDPDPRGPNAATGTVIDATGNGNTMRRFNEVNSPIYTTEVPGAIIPATGEANSLSLRFSGSFQDIYTDGKDINNPIVEAFTLEASFKADDAGTGPWHAVVSKESKRDASTPESPANCDLEGNDCTSPLPPLSLKITGDDPPRLTIEVRDAANNVASVTSSVIIQTGQWYHAVVVATSTELSLYLNSNDGDGYVLQGTTPVTGGGPLWMGGVDSENKVIGYETVWNIGKGMYNRELTDFFAGVIDEVRLSNTALEPAQFLWYTSPLLGDFNDDDHVDGADFQIFKLCATGAEIPYDAGNLPLGCNMVPDNEGIISPDIDADGDVDMDDFGVYQANYTG